MKLNVTYKKVDMSQAEALSRVASRDYMIVSVDAGGYFSMSSRPVFHGTSAEVLRECDRLANANAGKAFVAVQMIGGRFLPAVSTARHL